MADTPAKPDSPPPSSPTAGKPSPLPEYVPPRVPAWKKVVGRVIGISSMVGAVVMCVLLANELEIRPRTDDAYVRANVIGIAPHVSGRIIELNVVDNQPVERGDVLFVVDPRPYEVKVMEAQANLELVNLAIRGYEDRIRAAERSVDVAKAAVVAAEANAAYAAQYLARVQPLLERQFVTADHVDDARSKAVASAAQVQEAQANVARAEQVLQQTVTELGQDGDVNARRQAAVAQLDGAELFLDYCVVRSPIDGYVTNLNIVEGEYANTGQQVFGLVDRSVWYVMGYFKETFLKFLEPGMTVEIYLMAYPLKRFKGVVQGIGWALYQNNGATMGLLPDVSPTLDWVRLAQRFPVRIIVEDAPPDLPLRMGATASVIVLTREGELPPRRFPWLGRFFNWLGLDN
ncbi:MAG: biotin/lipoyl-binding protein [Phycisphaerales bacterium]|nr:biotin/lipoyl-binding protein [Phycisphaerales bacterium]